MIRRKKAICDGYSRLLEAMCDRTGIQSHVIHGYGRTSSSRIGSGKPDHAWNAVRLNNKWYLCDATWASGSGVVEGKFLWRYNKNYFLTPPELFVANHFPLEQSWMLLKDKPTISEFINGPILEDGFISNRINHFTPKLGTVKVRKDSVATFTFTSNALNVERKASITISHNKISEKRNTVLKQDNTGTYVLELIFNRKGRFVVDIYINQKLTFIYYIYVT